MPLICTTSPVPTIDSLRELIYSAIPEVPAIPVLPSSLLSVSPPFGSIRVPSLEISRFATDLWSNQILTTLSSVVQPLLSHLGIGRDVLPKIPILDMDLLDLIEGKAEAGIAAIKLALQNGITLPFVPTPFYDSFTSIDINAAQAFSCIVAWYTTTLPSMISSWIESVTGSLHLPGLPSLPTIPSFEEVYALIKARINSGMDLVSAFSLNTPGFPSFSLPSPLFRGLTSLELEFQEAMAMFPVYLLTVPLQIIVDFCNSTLSSLGFSFPTLCLPLSF